MSELINKEIESILALTLSSLREHERGQTRHRPEVYTHTEYTAHRTVGPGPSFNSVRCASFSTSPIFPHSLYTSRSLCVRPDGQIFDGLADVLHLWGAWHHDLV